MEENSLQISSKTFCREARIKRDATVPYNPQHNGVGKRKNMTIMEAAKAMLQDQKLPMCLWGEDTKIGVLIMPWEIRLLKNYLQV